MRKLHILVLEDNALRISQFQQVLSEHNVYYVLHAYDCIDMLKQHEYDLVFLDHDLNGKEMEFDIEDCGSVVADWIYNNKQSDKTLFIIHTLNEPRARYMNQLIPNSFKIPFVWKQEIFSKFIKIEDIEIT